MPWLITWQVPLVMLTELALVDQLAGQLMGAAQEGIGRRADPQAFPFGALLQVQPFLDRQHEGLFRIDVLAGVEDLPGDPIVNGRHRQVDDDVDIIGLEQAVDGLGADA